MIWIESIVHLDMALQAFAESSGVLGRRQMALDRLGYDVPHLPIHRDR